MGFAVPVCGHPALQVTVYATGRSHAEYCERLNKDGLCKQWAPWPPKPALDPVLLFAPDPPERFPWALVFVVVNLVAGAALLIALN